MKSLFVAVFIFVSAVYCISAASLHNDGFNLYSGKKNFEIGDTIKVILNEEREIEYKSESSSYKNASISGGEALKGIIEFLPAISGEDSISASKKGNSKTESKINTVINTEITNIAENGALFISGYHSFIVNNQMDILQISGKANPSDIISGDRIYSSDLIDIKIVYKNELINTMSITSNDLLTIQNISTNSNYMSITTEYELEEDKKKKMLLFYINKIISLMFN